MDVKPIAKLLVVKTQAKVGNEVPLFTELPRRIQGFSTP